MAIRFRLVAANLGVQEFSVSTCAETFRLSVRVAAGANEREAFDGTEAEFERDVVGAMGLAYRNGGFTRVTGGVIEAFNRWRSASQGEAMGAFDEGPASRPAPDPVRGGLYTPGQGWRIADDRSAMIEQIVDHEGLREEIEPVSSMRHAFGIGHGVGYYLVGDGGDGSVLTRSVFREIVEEGRSLRRPGAWVIYGRRNLYDGPGIRFRQLGAEVLAA